MKYQVNGLAVMLLVAMLVSCSDDDGGPAKLPASATGTYTDERDGETYAWVQYGKLQWMAENFRYDTGVKERCRIYINAEDYDQYADYNSYSREDVARYGMYYTYQGAVDACPAGWRLPTDEEWQELELMMGMSGSESGSIGWRGNVAMSMLQVQDNNTDLRLLLGGYVTLHTASFLVDGSNYKSAFGYYWTGTRDQSKDGESYFYRKFAYNSTAVYRQSMEHANQYLSVRYVREAE